MPARGPNVFQAAPHKATPARLSPHYFHPVSPENLQN